MQVNGIQSNNYNASFGRFGRSRFSSSSKSGVKEVLDSYCRGNKSNKSNKSKNSAKELAEALIDKCNEQELKQLAEKLEKKLSTPNIDTSWL